MEIKKNAETNCMSVLKWYKRGINTSNRELETKYGDYIWLI